MRRLFKTLENPPSDSSSILDVLQEPVELERNHETLSEERIGQRNPRSRSLKSEDSPSVLFDSFRRESTIVAPHCNDKLIEIQLVFSPNFLRLPSNELAL